MECYRFPVDFSMTRFRACHPPSLRFLMGQMLEEWKMEEQGTKVEEEGEGEQEEEEQQEEQEMVMVETWQRPTPLSLICVLRRRKRRKK